jgi:hypothetical protein
MGVRVPRQRVAAIEPITSLSPKRADLLARLAARVDEWEKGKPGLIGYWVAGGELVAYWLDNGEVIVAPPNKPGMDVIGDEESRQVADGSGVTVSWAKRLSQL